MTVRLEPQGDGQWRTADGWRVRIWFGEVCGKHIVKVSPPSGWAEIKAFPTSSEALDWARIVIAEVRT